MNILIDYTQINFIQRRNIHDNIICAQEILFKVRKSKEKGIMIKIDFEKAFDSVNWNFLLEVLQARGFGEKLRK
jgi:Reverse transcriptase (RNA-dependent DNA polymerase)